MPLRDVRTRWVARLAAFERYRAQVDAVTLVSEFLADLEELHAHEDEPISIPQAARETGYSPRHLRRLIGQGKLENAGRKGAPLVKRSALPAPRRVTAPQSRLSNISRGRTIRGKTQTARALIGSKES